MRYMLNMLCHLLRIVDNCSLDYGELWFRLVELRIFVVGVVDFFPWSHGCNILILNSANFIFKFNFGQTGCLCIFVNVYLFDNKSDEVEQISYQF